MRAAIVLVLSCCCCVGCTTDTPMAVRESEPSAPVLPTEFSNALTYGQMAKVQAFLQKDPRLIHGRTRDGRLTPLHVAAHRGRREVAALLIGLGARLDVRTKSGASTPLHLALVGFTGDWAGTMKLLLENGADPNARNSSGYTPLFLVRMWNRRTAVAPLLKKGATLGHPILDAAALGDGRKIQALLLKDASLVDKADERGGTPLLWAACMDHEDVCRILIEHKAAVDAVDRSTMTPLHWAARPGSPAAARLLIAAGAKVDATDKNGYTPLHTTIQQCGNMDMVKLLVKAGADIEKRTRSGDTPLLWAASGGSDEIVRFLIRAGADLAAMNELGKTVMQVADMFGKSKVIWAIRGEIDQGIPRLADDIRRLEKERSALYQEYWKARMSRRRRTLAQQRDFETYWDGRVKAQASLTQIRAELQKQILQLKALRQTAKEEKGDAQAADGARPIRPGPSGRSRQADSFRQAQGLRQDKQDWFIISGWKKQ